MFTGMNCAVLWVRKVIGPNSVGIRCLLFPGLSSFPFSPLVLDCRRCLPFVSGKCKEKSTHHSIILTKGETHESTWVMANDGTRRGAGNCARRGADTGVC